MSKFIGMHSWDAFIARAAERGSMPQLPGADGESTANSAGNDASVSYAEAMSMARNGWSAGAQAIADQLDSLVPTEDTAPGWRLDVAGMQPCVPALMSGEPECMWMRADNQSPERRLTLVVPLSYAWFIKASQASTYAIAVTAVMRELEASGNTVALYGVALQKNGFWYGITLREHGEPLDLAKIAFSMHPGFLRRVQFAWRERTAAAVAAGAANNNYGKVNIDDWTAAYIARLLPDAGHTVICPAVKDAVENANTLSAMIAYVHTAIDSAIAKAA